LSQLQRDDRDGLASAPYSSPRQPRIVAEAVRTLGPEKDAEFDNAPKRNRQAREHHDRAGREISGPEDGVGVANEVDAEAAKEKRRAAKKKPRKKKP